MTRCKPGDLAYVVGSRVNNGTIVEVLSAWTRSGKISGYSFPANMPAWLVRTVGRPLITHKWGKEIAFYERPIADAKLRPITPPANTVTQEETRELYDPRELVLVTRERA